MQICAAKTRSGAPCQKEPGWGTDHVGQGRCRLHGGATPIKHGMRSTIIRSPLRDLIEHHAANPDPLNILGELAIVRALLDDYINRYEEFRDALLAWHDSYSAVDRPLAEDRIAAIETVVDELEALVGPADLDEEPGGEDETRVRRAMREARKLADDLRRPSEGGKPRQVLDISDAVRHAEAVSRIVKRIEDVRAQNAISRPELMRIMQEMGRVVARFVPDDGTRDKIQDAWLQIRA